ncbi:MAG: hypothetical protein ACD_66C00239G0004 [uncultured bacterium]|uniref:Excinuclease ABC C subunit domain protein n=1 Tax=Candidatus Uhrbacteria bacterium GW2011_GWC1_41_20 TaxID=1618983 RepID=A0A0G0VB47_9BACT|nr:MAG: hypothetical protein ACD_66C00239G0004 [uncultured bacterium]KKR21225.1 MAG: Excinuclease ABC C subunit domain protein [Candidatus Uhrbacteria bacterium GW2011_GWE1_39_46]KKR89465.1 MAG: Excinuclease ABC C subunit domain protein [Candidatus Uhrbacteria bacterium GW2011_GWD2_41_121]KKR95521.1 MAG: Excinuclease ABC C subunit domain protein [Candidatus Uhrbacteria bacterium GW2011_GWD1_41_16]KKR98133.1 MAG: Excinuclease ABC C subunit domain protein [Candidatus Uhrbacteria bacterium GW2011_
MACIYILFSESKQCFYTGSSRSENAQIRLIAHNSGRVRSTKSGKPWILIYDESHADYHDARKRELFLKTGIGRKWVTEQFGHYKKEIRRGG